jgi:ubiquinone biosynthesis protein
MASISRSERYRKIVSVLIDEGFGTVFDQLGIKASWILALRREKPGPDASLAPETRARRTMERLGPTFAKIGQMLSVRPDLIPASYASEFAKLQDEMAPFAFEQVKEEIESVFGEALSELFAEFSETPAAAASIGQVHRATLLDGTPVAVKVQRPDVQDVIAADLDILRTQAARIQGRTDLGRRYDMVALVDEFAKAIRSECDYINEARNAQRLARMFERDTNVQFPKIYWERTAPTVLTLEWLDGIPFNRLDELDARGVDRHEAARKGIVCYYEQIFIHGFYHADPHPGNLFAMPDGRVAFTDFGRAGDLSDEARNKVADLLVAIIDQDGDLATDILLEVSGNVADVDVVGLKRDVTSLISKYYDMKLRDVDSRELVSEVLSLIGKRSLRVDSEFALLLTTLSTLQAMGSALDPEFHFVESVQPFVRRIVEEQIQPTKLSRNLVKLLRRTLRAAEGLPDNVNRAVKRIADGDLRVTVRPGEFDNIMARVEQSVDKLAFALVISAFVVGLSLLLARTTIPWWLELIADLALVGAAVVGFSFFASMMWGYFRKRTRD